MNNAFMIECILSISSSYTTKKGRDFALGLRWFLNYLDTITKKKKKISEINQKLRIAWIPWVLLGCQSPRFKKPNVRPWAKRSVAQPPLLQPGNKKKLVPEVSICSVKLKAGKTMCNTFSHCCGKLRWSTFPVLETQPWHAFFWTCLKRIFERHRIFQPIQSHFPFAKDFHFDKIRTNTLWNPQWFFSTRNGLSFSLCYPSFWEHVDLRPQFFLEGTENHRNVCLYENRRKM